ncbi:hypothetical protein EI555_004711, partial [Monodon monoceros]
SLGYVFRVLQGGRGHLLQEQRAGPSAGPVVRWLLPEGALVPPNPSPCSQGAADPSCSPAPVGSGWGYTALDESRFKGPQTPSVHMATLERRQGLDSGGVCAEGAGLTDGWGLPQASQLATAQATPGGNGSQMLLSGLGVSLPMYGKRRLAAVSWSNVPGLCPRGSPCGRKEVVLGGADKPSCPRRKGRQVADGEARSLLAAGPNCSGGTKCELIAGPARASGPHTPDWGSFTHLPSWGGGRPCLDPHLLPPSPGPHNSQSLEAPFSPLQGPLGSPVRPGRFLFTEAQSSCSQRRATDARGRMYPSGTIVHPGSPPPGSPPPGVCLCVLPLCQLTPCVYPATSPLRHRALHLRSLLRLLTSSRLLSDKTLLFNRPEVSRNIHLHRAGTQRCSTELSQASREADAVVSRV